MLYIATLTVFRGTYPASRRVFIESDDYTTAYAIAQGMTKQKYRPVVCEYVPPMPDVTMTKAQFLEKYGSEAYKKADNIAKWTKDNKYTLNQTAYG